MGLAKLGIVKDTTAWLVHTGLAVTAVCVLVIWFASGLTMMLLMAGMQSVPTELYESARVDGASWWSAERSITLPLLRRSIVLSLIISVVGSFLAFNQFYIMTQGGPGTSTMPVVMSIVNTGFTQFNIGAASAMSVVLIIVVGLISFAQFHFLQRDGTLVSFQRHQSHDHEPGEPDWVRRRSRRSGRCGRRSGRPGWLWRSQRECGSRCSARSAGAPARSLPRGHPARSAPGCAGPGAAGCP